MLEHNEFNILLIYKKALGHPGLGCLSAEGNVDRMALTVDTQRPHSVTASAQPGFTSSSSSSSSLRRGRASKRRTFWQQNLLTLDAAS